MYHPSCQAQPLVCNRCNLLEESLDYRSISQLYCGYFSNQYHTHTVEFGTPEVEEARMSHHCTYIVEARIRPVRVGKGKLHRQFGLYLNKQIVKLKCGQLNVRLPVRILSSVNSLIIHTKHYPAHVPQQYAIGTSPFTQASTRSCPRPTRRSTSTASSPACLSPPYAASTSTSTSPASALSSTATSTCSPKPLVRGSPFPSAPTAAAILKCSTTSS